MIDGIIKADGTSRLMRANLPATYEEFKAQAAAGSLPLDVLFNADGWNQLPTFLNKANLLKDATALLFGFGSEVVPDNVFSFLGKYNLHWWNRTFYEGKFVQDTIATGYFMGYQTANTVSYSTEVIVDSSGNVALKNPKTVNVLVNESGTATIKSVLLGKYVTGLRKSNTSNATLDGVYFVPTDAIIETNSRDYWGQYAAVYLVEYKDVNSGSDFVRSSDRNAYPDSGTVDGVRYQYLGVPFQNALTAPRIATGSYTGTGTYGANNPNRLTFDFAPKVVLLLGVTGSDGTSWSSRLGKTDYGSNTIMVLDAMTTEYKQRDGFINSNKADYNNYGRKSADGKTVEWYSTISTDTQCNTSGVKFYHLAVG